MESTTSNFIWYNQGWVDIQIDFDGISKKEISLFMSSSAFNWLLPPVSALLYDKRFHSTFLTIIFCKTTAAVAIYIIFLVLQYSQCTIIVLIDKKRNTRSTHFLIYSWIAETFLPLQYVSNVSVFSMVHKFHPWGRSDSQLFWNGIHEIESR